MRSIESQCKAAFEVATEMGTLPTVNKDAALKAMSEALVANTDVILEANKRDIENGHKNGLIQALIDRLTLNPDRIKGVADSLLVIADLKDPVGDVLSQWTVENGLEISKVRVPLGVIGIIYEARPNVTADAIALSIKTGNCVVLRGSSSAYESNKAMSDVLREAAASEGVPGDGIQLLDDTSREGVKTFVQMNDYLSMVIPRGGAALIKNVVETATVPSIETGVGNCHVYVDKDANLEKALPLVVNAKTHRPSVCNACESLLVHQDLADGFLPQVLQALVDAGVEIRGCSRTQSVFPAAKPASEGDWDEEFLDMILAVKVVDSLDGALAHIHEHGSRHSEAIVSENADAIKTFVETVDAAAVLVNASTRFTDGGEFGFGAEMGISTQKLHARGPMGLPELTTYKYVVRGEGHIRP